MGNPTGECCDATKLVFTYQKWHPTSDTIVQHSSLPYQTENTRNFAVKMYRTELKGLKGKYTKFEAHMSNSEHVATHSVLPGVSVVKPAAG